MDERSRCLCAKRDRIFELVVELVSGGRGCLVCVAIGLNNAYVLHQLAPEESRVKMNQKEWRIELMKQLVNDFTCVKQRD